MDVSHVTDICHLSHVNQNCYLRFEINLSVSHVTCYVRNWKSYCILIFFRTTFSNSHLAKHRGTFLFSSQEEANGFCAKISLSSSPACLPFAQRDKILFCQISAVCFPIKRLQAILDPKKGVGIFIMIEITSRCFLSGV